MSETVASRILKGYYELEGHCLQNIGKYPLQPLGEVDQTDIAMVLMFLFNPQYETGDYYPILKQYASKSRTDSISEEELEKVYPQVKKYIHEILTLIKEN